MKWHSNDSIIYRIIRRANRMLAIVPEVVFRAVASLTVPGGQELLHFPHFFLKFRSIFPQTLLIFFLILALRVGESPTQEGPGYATGCARMQYFLSMHYVVKGLSARIYSCSERSFLHKSRQK